GCCLIVRKVAAALPYRCHFKFRWTFAIHSPASRHLKIFLAHFQLQRNRGRQARPGNLSARREVNKPEAERNPACRRRSATRLGSSEPSWSLGVSAESTTKFDARL